MGGADFPRRASDKVETAAPHAPPVAAAAGVRLADSPILLLISFHKALRAELAELRRLALTALDAGAYCRGLIVDLRRRFEYLNTVYKYHCAGEDEVVFLALDVRIQNVVCTYSLEHRSIDDLFESLFHDLDVLLENDENVRKPFEELVCRIGAIQSTICQHMLKEEEQVFPLLMQQFSLEEQASLVWTFICGIPITLLEEFLPWITSFLPPDELVNFVHCIKEVVPKEKLLQEVVTSWITDKNQIKNIKGVQCPECPCKCVPGENWHWNKTYILPKNVGQSSVDGLYRWHGAIRKDLKEVLEELYQIQSSNNFSTLASVIVQLKFLVDVVIFYCNALSKIFYPVLKTLASDCVLSSYERFPDERPAEDLQRLLYNNAQTVLPMCKSVQKLCWELESFEKRFGKYLDFQETEVLPLLSKNCNNEMQQQLLCMSLHIMPLGLLKCVITWFSTHLSEDESKSILQTIKHGGSLVNKSFAYLLHEYVRNGYSGKTSVEKFRKNLQEMLKSRGSFLLEQLKVDVGFSSLYSDSQPCKRPHSAPMEPHSAPMEPNSINKGKHYEANTSSGSCTAEKCSTLYYSEINLHIFFPGTLKTLYPHSEFPAEKSGATSIIDPEPKPVDLIFFFHKALKKDLEFLVLGSAKMIEDIGVFVDFRRRFHLIWYLFQIHSDAEDEIAFPALEAKGKGQNICHSYTIDHRLEVEHFNKISFILDDIYKLHISVSGVDVNALDQRVLKYHKLCMKLHDMCKSMHKVMGDHVHHEDIELWPLFRECFSIQEQEKIVGCMLGRTGAEILQQMIPWLMASLTAKEQHVMMSLWRKATRHTMFDEWLGEWWEDMNTHNTTQVGDELKIHSSCSADPLEVVFTYLSNEGFINKEGRAEGIETQKENSTVVKIETFENQNADNKKKFHREDQHNLTKYESSKCTEISAESNKKRLNGTSDVKDWIKKQGQLFKVSQTFRHGEHLITMSQEDLEAAIRRISRDSSLDPQKKSYIIQNLLMSHWIVAQQKSDSEATILSNKEGIRGQSPSYQNPQKLIFGCKHYKRNCKLLAACCNQIYTCRHCHDDVADHSLDRKSTTKMMCMKCLIIQPIRQTCSTVSCNNLSMARYYCRICKLFDDGREIYHCPYCNLCRVGRGLGIDYFHCMSCNACMSRSLSVHICREKCFEDNCPICHEYIFTSSAPVKALPCGHLMHSMCFQDYTCTHYTCPICSKSLGDMQVYFRMLDAFLAEDKMPDEYAGQTQVILCNDCEKRGTALFHWLYHKCSYCGSYNTRLL